MTKKDQWFLYWQYKYQDREFAIENPVMTRNKSELKYIYDRFENHYIYTFPQLKQISSKEELETYL